MKSSIQLTVAMVCLAAVGCNTSDSHEGTQDASASGADMSTPTVRDASMLVDGTIIVQSDGGEVADGTVVDGTVVSIDGGMADGTVALEDMAADMPAPLVTMDDYLRAYAAIVCERFDCVEEASPEGLFIRRLVAGNTVGSACTDRVARYFENVGMPTSDDLERLGITFDATAAATCLSDLSTGECLNVFNLQTNCFHHALVTTAGDGASCDFNFNVGCGAGFTCTQTVGPWCGGVCRPSLARGEACTNSDQCVLEGTSYWASRTCEVDPDHTELGSVCMTDDIVFDLEEGDACGNVRDTVDFARVEHRCKDGFGCQGYDGSTPGHCVSVTRAAVGEECDSHYTTPCVEGSLCLFNTCVGLDVASTIGASCGFVESRIQICDVAAGIACDNTMPSGYVPGGNCVALGDGSEGSACGGDFAKSFGFKCNEGLRCTAGSSLIATVGTCVPLTANDEPCTSYDECASGYCGYSEMRMRSECQEPLACDG